MQLLNKVNSLQWFPSRIRRGIKDLNHIQRLRFGMANMYPYSSICENQLFSEKKKAKRYYAGPNMYKRASHRQLSSYFTMHTGLTSKHKETPNSQLNNFDLNLYHQINKTHRPQPFHNSSLNACLPELESTSCMS